MTRRIFGFGCASLFVSSAALARVRPVSASVLLIPSMHRRMAASSLYTYENLYSAVAKFSPNFVGVEIRQEDLGRDDVYLSANYPLEMIELLKRYVGRSFGFDWLGDDLAGRPIPADWWKTKSPIKRLERESGEISDTDRPGRNRLSARLATLSDEQDQILRTATLTALANGRYDRVTRSYYATLRQLYAGTRFAALPAFYGRRDERLASNVASFVRSHPGQRIVVVTGADHHGPVMAALRHLGCAVHIAPVS